MPLPGLNPMEAAPPAGSTEQVATAAQAARLHQRITDLERRLDTERRARLDDASYNEISWISAYWVPYTTDRPPFANWTGLVVAKSGNICTFQGLFKSGTAWSGSTPATYSSMFQLPAGCRPASYHMGMMKLFDTANQKGLVAAEITASGLVSMRIADGFTVGTSNGTQTWATPLFNAWVGT